MGGGVGLLSRAMIPERVHAATRSSRETMAYAVVAW